MRMEMPVQQSSGFVNGVDMGKLESTLNSIKHDPDLAAFRFHIVNEWISGTKSETSAQRIDGGPQIFIRTEPFKMRADQPYVLMGTDSAPCAIVSLLHSLASCLSISIVYAASRNGICIDKMSIVLEGDMDVQGILGLSDVIRPGLKKLEVHIDIDSNAPAEQIREIVHYAQKHSPVLDTLINHMELDINLA